VRLNEAGEGRSGSDPAVGTPRELGASLVPARCQTRADVRVTFLPSARRAEAEKSRKSG
jgi:hypothetical protein